MVRHTFISDADAKTDALEFKPYVEGLASLITNADTETPLTIGVLGSWGTGKTSLLRQLRDTLRDPNGPAPFDGRSDNHTLWLNVWELSLQGNLTRSFLQALLTDCRQRLPLRQRLEFDLHLLRGRIDSGAVLRQLVQNSYRLAIALLPLIFVRTPMAQSNSVDVRAGALTSLVLALWLVVKPAVEAARDKVSLDLGKLLRAQPYELQVSVLREMRTDFQCLVDLWTRKRGRLVIFVDDLDRCPPDMVPGLLEAIKLFLTVDRCIYILAVDEEVIAASIQQKYTGGPRETAVLFDGKRYLDKIIQLPFRLPEIESSRIEEYIESFRARWPEGAENSAKVFAYGLPPNPRAIKRAVNVFLMLSDFVKHRRIGEWVTPLRLAKIVALQTAYGPVFERLKNAPELIISIESAALQPGDSRPQAAVDGLAVPDDVRMQRAFFELFRLFPEDETARFGSLPPDRLRAFFSLAGRASTSADSAAPESAELKALVDRYHVIRRTQPSGSERTRAMTALATQMVTLSASHREFNIQAGLDNDEAGWRLAAYAFLYGQPNPDFLVQLATTVVQREDQPFGQFWGLQAVDACLTRAKAAGLKAGPEVRSELHVYEQNHATDTDPSRLKLARRILDGLPVAT